jgi:D-arabinose 1-dehydrogenase-like Zn-dependent alcohol dehydrogenase
VRGVILPGKERVEIKELDVPEPGYGQVLVKMKASGLCGSDLRAIYHEHRGSDPNERYQNVVAGHEPAGLVEAVGPGASGFEPGDRVVVYHIAGCGRCEECRKGFMIGCHSPDRSAYGWQRDGGHADFLLAEARTLLHLPDELTTPTAPSWPAALAPPTRASCGPTSRVATGSSSSGWGPSGLGW